MKKLKVLLLTIKEPNTLLQMSLPTDTFSKNQNNVITSITFYAYLFIDQSRRDFDSNLMWIQTLKFKFHNCWPERSFIVKRAPHLRFLATFCCSLLPVWTTPTSILSFTDSPFTGYSSPVLPSFSMTLTAIFSSTNLPFAGFSYIRQFHHLNQSFPKIIYCVDCNIKNIIIWCILRQQ